MASYGGKGGGPGELQNALGIMQSQSGLLFVPDQRNARIAVLSVDSGFVTSYPLRLYRYGFVWTGVMREDDHILVPSMVLKTQRDLTRIYSLQMIQVDSVLEPEYPPVELADPPGAFAWRTADGRVQGFRQVPFYATGAAFLDRTGELWSSTHGDPSYRVARTTLRGDTSLIIKTTRAPLPVSSEERDSAMAVVYDELSEYGVRDLDASKVPPAKPTVLNLFTDDHGQLWVQTSSPDSLCRYDVYEREGAYLGSAATHLKVVPYVKPVVRGDLFYAVVTDEVDVPYVVRARILKRHVQAF